MRLELFDYPLPPERIAQSPAEPRDAARLLLLAPRPPEIEHRRFTDFPDLLNEGDLLVFNDTRVLPARLTGRKRTGGAAELLLLRRLSPGTWEALVLLGRRLPEGAELDFGEGELRAVVGGRRPEGTRLVRFVAPADPEEAESVADRLGRLPLPPYITAELPDPGRYQTIYARDPGSAAAPTAGLHFTDDVFRRLAERGVRTAFVTLHVGIATFRPVRAEAIEEHVMHLEHYTIPPEMAAAVAVCAGRVVAVGTTTVRCLESAATGPRQVRCGPAETDLYIQPGYPFRVVDALLTNFHMPRSSLLILVSAFVGRERLMAAYDAALREGYRFLSFGDAMFIPCRAPRSGK